MAYNELNKEVIKSASIIVNTTPVGMAPNSNICPSIPYQHITNEHLVYDLIYNPEKTLFLSQASANGASVQNGLTMLKLQAERSWEIWNNVSA
jgi:shikimate dehydrogenase